VHSAAAGAADGAGGHGGHSNANGGAYGGAAAYGAVGRSHSGGDSAGDEWLSAFAATMVTEAPQQQGGGAGGGAGGGNAAAAMAAAMAAATAAAGTSRMPPAPLSASNASLLMPPLPPWLLQAPGAPAVSVNHAAAAAAGSGLLPLPRAPLPLLPPLPPPPPPQQPHPGVTWPAWAPVPPAQLKLHDTDATALPDTLGAFLHTWMGSAVTLGYIAPGCTLLTLRALAPPGWRAGGGAGGGGSDDDAVTSDAERLAAALLAGVPALRAKRFDVRCASDGSSADVRGGRVSASGTVVCPAAAAALAQTPCLPPLRPRALCSTSAGALASTAPAAASGALRFLFHGHHLVTNDDDDDDEEASATEGAAVSLQLPPTALEGALSIGFAPDADNDAEEEEESGSSERGHHDGGVRMLRLLGGALRSVLLTPDADVAAEVATLGACAVDEAAAEAVVLTLGCALQPRAPLRLLRVAAAVAAARRWPATLTRLLPALAAAEDATEEEVEASRALRGADAESAAARDDEQATTVLHAAAAGGCASCVRAVLAAAAACPRMGTPLARDAHGATPLHAVAYAAAAADDDDAAGGAAAARLLIAACPAAPLAWFGARDVAGFSPADVAARRAGGGGGALRGDMRAALSRAVAAARDALHDAASGGDGAAGAHEALAAQLGDDEAAAAEVIRYAFKARRVAEPRWFWRPSVFCPAKENAFLHSLTFALRVPRPFHVTQLHADVLVAAGTDEEEAGVTAPAEEAAQEEVDAATADATPAAAPVVSLRRGRSSDAMAPAASAPATAAPATAAEAAEQPRRRGRSAGASAARRAVFGL
jgi:hypothetical protein